MKENAGHYSESGGQKTNKRRKLFSIFTTILCIIILAASVVAAINLRASRQGMVGPDIAGFRLFVGLTGSMEPTIKTGSLIVTKEKEPNRIKVGDVLSYRSVADREVVVTHRIVEVDDSGDSPLFITKGDNNSSRDPNPVKAENALGVVVFYINAFPFFTSPPGIVLLVATFILVVFIIPSLLKLLREKD